MKKYLFFLCLFFILFQPKIFAAPEVLSESAVMIDPKTGNVLFDKNMHKKMYPASITKVLTAILAIENGDFSDEVQVNASAIDGLPWDGVSMGLKNGEIISIDYLLKGLLVPSANDAANVLAEHISGSVPAFVELMNKRAQELGALNSNFMNPSGLHDDNHYSTAYDLAMICKYAMTIPKFRDTVDIAHIYIPETNLSQRKYFINTNSLISNQSVTQYYYAPAIGIKTGRTSLAGQCLAAAAGKGKDFELITVVMNAPTVNNTAYHFVDSKTLFEYGYKNYTSMVVARPGDILDEVKPLYSFGKEYVSLLAEKDVTVLLPKDAKAEDIKRHTDIDGTVRTPIKEGQELGTMYFTYGDTELGSVKLLSDREVKRHPLWFVFAFFVWLWGFVVFRIFVIVTICVISLYCVIFIAGIIQAAKKR